MFILLFTYCKDLLGNVRLSYKKNGSNLQILEEDNYYPFGLKHKGYNTTTFSSNLGQKIKYLGQERQEELGVNWDIFRYRNYDYAIGRFFGVDPITEKYVSISPYQFAHNNPVWKIELEGLEGVPTTNTDIIDEEEILSAAINASLQTKLQQNQTAPMVKPAQSQIVSVSYEMEGRSIIDEVETVGNINNVVDKVATGIENNTGNTRIGSNGRLYYENSNGNVFHGNQHVTTSSLAKMGSNISKFTGPVGDVIDAINMGAAIYEDGGIGPQSMAAGANIAGGALGAELGAMAGAKIGAVLFAWSGPGAVAAAAVGGVIGAIAGGYYGGEAAESLIKENKN